MTSQIEIFPVELTDMIIDFLHQDKASLAACTLVCVGWLNSSRYHLFASLVLDTHKIQKDEKELLEFLQSPSNLGYFVHEFRITGRYRRTNLSMATLVLFTQRMPNLRILKLCHLELQPLYCGQPAMKIPSPSEHQSLVSCLVQELWLIGVYWRVEIADLLHLTPALENLFIDRAVLQTERFETPPRSSDLPLRSISLQSPTQPYSTMLSQISDRSSLNHLTSLAIGSRCITDMPVIGRVILKARHSLKELRLDIGKMEVPHGLDIALLDDTPAVDSEWSILNLKTCQSLRSFSVSLPLRFCDHYHCVMHQLAMAVLASQLPTTTEEVSMGVVYYTYGGWMEDIPGYWQVTGTHWEIFRAAMERLHMLKTIHFYQTPATNESDDSGRIPFTPSLQIFIRQKLSLADDVILL